MHQKAPLASSILPRLLPSLLIPSPSPFRPNPPLSSLFSLFLSLTTRTSHISPPFTLRFSPRAPQADVALAHKVFPNPRTFVVRLGERIFYEREMLEARAAANTYT